MNREEDRLVTFTNWPSDAPVSPARIAKAGFYWLGDELRCECFSCGLQISDWNYGDQVMARHRQLNPDCDFVIDVATSGNIPIRLESETHPEQTTEASPDFVDSLFNSCRLIHEPVRLQTFTTWPISHIVSPAALARSGFFYLKHRDKTRCAFCEGVIVAWERGDDPDREHKRHFPNCSFVQAVINPRLERVDGGNSGNEYNDSNLQLSNVNVISQSNLQELGINTHSAPKRSRYATLESRLQTFAAWPDDLIQTPDSLAQAGFYYENDADQVRCFHCDGGLKHWDPQDDPWTEHARWFPKCAYVQLVKGRDFITACAVETDVPREVGAGNGRPSRSIQRREITENEVQMHMLTPQVIAALNVGLHVGRVKQALKEKLERTGVGFSTPDAVIEAALNLQHDEEEADDTHISDEVTRVLSSVISQSLIRSEIANETNKDSLLPPSVSASVPDSSESAPEEKKVLSLEEENRLLKEERLCKICMDVEVGIVFLPCGHLATCVNCAPNLQDCPVCRCAIKATVRTFFS